MTEEKNFEKSMSRLNEIVGLLEKNEQPLEETLKLFEEGVKLVKVCDEKLKDFELKVEEIVNE